MPTTPIEGGLTEGDEQPEEGSEPFDDVFKDSRENDKTNNSNTQSDDDDFEPIDNSIH